jgi:holo-ACP synthase/triphosphoribosyl-dephospho-CoA synthase
MKVNSMLDILNARDERVKVQQELIGKYKLPLISFTLNIAGNIKRSPLFDIIFDKGLQSILSEIKINIIYKQIKRDDTGSLALIVVDDEITSLKRKMVEIENSSPSARLYDIDVIKTDFKPISRLDIGLDVRGCLICDKPYLVCRRNKTHTLEEVINTTKKISQRECASLLSNIASYSLKAELSTTPKPGLVDRNNNGSHLDMSFELFLKSIETITPYLEEEYLTAFKISNKIQLFHKMKEIGLSAESSMLNATENINTHKGAFFSLSAIGCGICYLIAQDKKATIYEIRLFASDFAKWAQQNNRDNISNGYKVRENNIKVGIYFEAINGYPSIFESCSKFLNNFEDIKYREYLSPLLNKEEFSLRLFNEMLEDKALGVFCKLLSCVNDSNIIHRGGSEALLEMHRLFKRLDSENLSIYGLKEELYKCDLKFIESNLSPGGTADLLTIALFIMILKALNIVQ